MKSTRRVLNLEKIEQNCTAAEYIKLRDDSGWGVPIETDAQIAIENSLIVFVMRIDQEAVGIVRVAGDGKICFYIQDLIVLKQYQKMDHGRELFEAVLEYIYAHATPNAFIGLMAAKGVERPYATYGFIARPNDHLGPGMVKFSKSPEVVTET